MKLYIWIYQSYSRTTDYAVAMAYDASHARSLILQAGHSMYPDFQELNPLKQVLEQAPDYVLHDPNAFIIEGG